jgi:hypothetical protein
VQFWYVRNSQGLRDSDWSHNAAAATFSTENDLDTKIGGESKEDVLNRMTFSFRQGVLVPGAHVFNAFASLLQAMYEGEVPGFAPVASLDDLGQFARVRMEFLKRLCTAKYGIYDPDTPTPIAGEVHVYGVGRDGRVCEYLKHRNQVHILRPGRT